MLIFEINARLTYLHDSTNFIAPFECKALKVFTLKYTNYGGIYGCDIISLEKLTKRQNSESCKADFWPVGRLGSSLNFKRINSNESFRHYYIHRKDYVMRFENHSVELFQGYTEKH